MFKKLQGTRTFDVGGDHGHVDLQWAGLCGGEGRRRDNDGLNANSEFKHVGKHCKLYHLDRLYIGQSSP